jgi:capsular polysaccharide biosynthesis protein
MRVDEVTDRIVRRHALLLVAFVLAGMAAVWLIHSGDRAEYAASARLVLDSPDPANSAQAGGLADTARAIATGHAVVAAALSDAGVRRDPYQFGREQIDVASLGASGVLQLTVRDTDRRAAVVIANALAEEVIAARQRVSDGTASTAVRTLTRQVSQVQNQLADVEQQIDDRSPAPGAPVVPDAALRRLERSRDTLNQQLGQLQGQLVAIQGQRALRPQASVLDRANSAPTVPRRLVADYLLGALLGLVLGLAAAAARETFSPSVVGPAALARALGAPVLAHPRGGRNGLSAAEAEVAARHLELAAAAAGVVRIEVMTLSADRAEAVLVDAVADQLCSATAGPAEPVGQADHQLSRSGARELPAGMAAEMRRDRSGDSPGLVAVSPDVVRLADLAAVQNMTTLTGWPLLGVVVLRMPRTPWWRWLLLRRAAKTRSLTPPRPAGHPMPAARPPIHAGPGEPATDQPATPRTQGGKG